jgi:S-DNA-T family DNA segregation ATPase FtsK/SpoIIIE
VDLGDACPVVIVVLEEYPGLLRWIESIDTKLCKRVRGSVARLIAEGRKVGYRVLIITQRADAAVVGAYERGQASHRISYRVDTLDAIKMLHPDTPPDVVAAHATADPGIGLLTAPGRPLTRFRGPRVDYGGYCAAVTP